MSHRIFVPLFMVLGLFLLASCSGNQASPTASANMANPASVYCEQNSGKVDLRTDASGGVAGICVFPDGSECDEWTYFRGECKPGDSLAQANMANPASVHCEQNGGKVDLRTDASGGVVGICVFPDGSECNEWAFFRGECKPGDSLARPEPAKKTLRVVYFKDGQVMQWTEGKGPQSLVNANAEHMRISDDGQAVAYLGTNSAGAQELYGVNADGTNKHLLVSRDQLQSTSPSGRVVSFDFAPGSHMLYFVTDSYDLQRVDFSGASPESIFAAGKGGFFRFSPDGQWMALYHPNELVLSRPDGADARVDFQYPADFSYSMVGPDIAWKADSSGFSIVSASGAQGQADSMTVWFIPLDGQPVKQMSYAGPYGANLSPDGSQVVYLDFQHEPVEVHIVTRDGKDSLYASYASNTYPAIDFMGWAPDSKSFLLNLSKDGRLKDPYQCAAGESSVPLTDSADAYPVTWVDAERVLFVSAGNLRLQKLGEPSLVVDSISGSSFDFTLLTP